ncbi:IS1 family transposase [Halomicronema sp. CCY15110]|uniref:IS1/IS1595 family N-terminal zinc-binding domain-containing protein n=1 Tax=Halomicronema sp. CCY15110 TaxID=2767773 RepID=UPI001EF3458B|nr:IS1 family transposase [Halomicronema sp. CCY15110]
MVLEPVGCPHCHTTNVVKNGKSGEGQQRYRCRHANCTRASFILDYTYRGHVLEVKAQVSEMAMKDSGIRDPARVLGISPTTVIEELKKTSTSVTHQPAGFSLLPRSATSGHRGAG